jgi:hypothetical protein
MKYGCCCEKTKPVLSQWKQFLQIEYPEHVHLIRGNHEAADINALFGFRLECIERMVIMITLHVFARIEIFDTLADLTLLYRVKVTVYGLGLDSTNCLTISHWLP